jgi:protein-tyrosine phosphatase
MAIQLPKWMRGVAARPAADADALQVLMVCMGNICRSPTAEAVLRSKLERAGLGRRVIVDSAGMIATHSGEPPDPRSIRHAARRGYDLSALRARQVQAEDFQRFDWMFAMDADNLAWLERKAPAGSRAQKTLLLTQANFVQDDQGIPDPYYGSPEGFERVLDLIEAACDGFVQKLGAQ